MVGFYLLQDIHQWVDCTIAMAQSGASRLALRRFLGLLTPREEVYGRNSSYHDVLNLLGPSDDRRRTVQALSDWKLPTCQKY